MTSEVRRIPVSRTIPEMRGLSRDERPDPEKPYSKESYAAQYGITLRDAEGLAESYRTHGEVKRAIYAMFSRNEGLRRRALMLDGVVPPSPEELADYEKLLKRLGARSLAKEMA